MFNENIYKNWQCEQCPSCPNGRTYGKSKSVLEKWKRCGKSGMLEVNESPLHQYFNHGQLNELKKQTYREPTNLIKIRLQSNDISQGNCACRIARTDEPDIPFTQSPYSIISCLIKHDDDKPKALIMLNELTKGLQSKDLDGPLSKKWLNELHDLYNETCSTKLKHKEYKFKNKYNLQDGNNLGHRYCTRVSHENRFSLSQPKRSDHPHTKHQRHHNAHKKTVAQNYKKKPKQRTKLKTRITL